MVLGVLFSSPKTLSSIRMRPVFHICMLSLCLLVPELEAEIELIRTSLILRNVFLTFPLCCFSYHLYREDDILGILRD